MLGGSWIMKCDQMKCTFNQIGGCRKCELCGAEPNEINDDCDKCWNCKSDEGVLRWDNSNDGEVIFEAEENKEQEKLLKVVTR